MTDERRLFPTPNFNDDSDDSDDAFDTAFASVSTSQLFELFPPQPPPPPPSINATDDDDDNLIVVTSATCTAISKNNDEEDTASSSPSNTLVIATPATGTAISKNNDEDTVHPSSNRRNSNYAPPPHLSTYKETHAATRRNLNLHQMLKSKKQTTRIMHHVIVCSSFLDPLIWFFSFLAMYIYVRPTIVDSNRAGWELTRRVRTMTAGYHEVEDSKSMFSFLKDTIIPSLAPSVPSPAMQSTWMTVINNQNNNVQTLKDGRLNIQNNIFTLRQIRSKNLYISNGEEEKNQLS